VREPKISFASINADKSVKYKILGCLEFSDTEVGQTVTAGVRCIGTITHLKTFLIEHVVDQVIFALPLGLIDDIGQHIRTAEDLGVSVRIVPDWNLRKIGYKPGIGQIELENFCNVPTICLKSSPSANGELQIKNLLDFFGASLLIVLSFPLFVMISILIKIISKGPILFSQERCGLNGRRFNVYKFRTMIHKAEHIRARLDFMNESDGPGIQNKKRSPHHSLHRNYSPPNWTRRTSPAI
jgi:hypothetical protein